MDFEQLNNAQRKNREYNYSQAQVGHPLRTLKGSVVKRSPASGVGKVIGGQIYFHKSYYKQCLPEFGLELYEAHEDSVPFEFSCLRYNFKTDELTFVECPDFDIDSEPVVGRMYIIIDTETKGRLTRFFNQIYHHKWTFVDNSYSGFNVAESWEWSREWLSVLTEPADGSNISNWENQLHRFGLI